MFTYVQCDTTNKIEIIIRLLLQVATKTLPFYKDYFNVPYPLPKIDLIAIADFAAGELNWTDLSVTDWNMIYL